MRQTPEEKMIVRGWEEIYVNCIPASVARIASLFLPEYRDGFKSLT